MPDPHAGSTQAGLSEALGFGTYFEAADAIPRLAEAGAQTTALLYPPTLPWQHVRGMLLFAKLLNQHV